MKTNVKTTGAGSAQAQETQEDATLVVNGSHTFHSLRDPVNQEFIRKTAKEWAVGVVSESLNPVCDVLFYLECWRDRFPAIAPADTEKALYDTRMDVINQASLAVDYFEDVRDLFHVIRKLADAGDAESIKIIAKRGGYLADEANDAFQWNLEQAEKTHAAAYTPAQEA